MVLFGMIWYNIIYDIYRLLDLYLDIFCDELYWQNRKLVGSATKMSPDNIYLHTNPITFL